MFKFGTYYLKNDFYPLSVAETLELKNGDYVLVRTEKGEEVVKVVIICPNIAKKWEESKKIKRRVEGGGRYSLLQKLLTPHSSFK